MKTRKNSVLENLEMVANPKIKVLLGISEDEDYFIISIMSTQLNSTQLIEYVKWYKFCNWKTMHYSWYQNWRRDGTVAKSSPDKLPKDSYV